MELSNHDSEIDLVDAHLNALTELTHGADDPAQIAAAAMLLAVSLGYSPTEITLTITSQIT